MIIRDLKIVCEYAGGELYSPKDIEIRGVSKDTRTLNEGNLYIPIIGQKFDGHDFIEKAKEKGAVASLWQRSHPIPDIDMPLILVDDVLKAFHLLAKNYRLSLKTKIIAITGSNGKTTTKDMLSSVLSQKYRVSHNKGNENNEIGVPLTLLNLSDDTEIGIVEMGTERFGEIIVLTEMAKPDIAIITNIGDSHLEELFTKENVAKEKLDIIKGLPDDGVFIYNNDDPVLRKAVKSLNIRQRVLSYGMMKSNYIIDNIQISSKNSCFTINGKVYSIPLIGIHQVYNAATSIVVSDIYGLDISDIANGFKNIKTTGMRNELKKLKNFSILDDSYKSNPQNLISALSTLYYLEGYSRKIAVLGDMLGLGKDAESLHSNIGNEIDNKKIDYLFFYGDLMKKAEITAKKRFDLDRVKSYDDKEKLFEDLKKILKDSIVLVKGSRDMHMEDIVNMLIEYDKEGN